MYFANRQEFGNFRQQSLGLEAPRRRLVEAPALERRENRSTSRVQLPASAVEICRRRFLHVALATALTSFPGSAEAQAYPSRAVRIIVGFPPGGAADITARVIGQWLSERLGPPFVIENRAGAGTNIGTEAVARAPADGYTLLLVSVANTVNATLYKGLTSISFTTSHRSQVSSVDLS
jgi:Tripartite tricarboxylate transporter family receptor